MQNSYKIYLLFDKRYNIEDIEYRCYVGYTGKSVETRIRNKVLSKLI